MIVLSMMPSNQLQTIHRIYAMLKEALSMRKPREGGVVGRGIITLRPPRVIEPWPHSLPQSQSAPA